MFINHRRAAPAAGKWLTDDGGWCRAARPIRQPPSSINRAFTLIEVVIGLTILTMITGTLFAIVKGSVRGAADIERVQRENDSINRLIELFRQTFQTMPGTATLTLTITEQSDPVMQELTIGNSPHCFGFGTSPTSYKDSIIGLRPDTAQSTSTETNAPRYNLSVSREDLIPKTDDSQLAIRQDTNSLTAPDEEGRYWMPLLPAVTSLSWRFYKQSDDTWEEEWSDSKWPDLIEMNLAMDGRTQPLRAVFGVPVLSLRAASGRSSTTPTTTPPAGGGTTAPSGGGTPAGGGGAPTGGGSSGSSSGGTSPPSGGGR
jgi:type II secretory pathway pseudopilin PulG